MSIKYLRLACCALLASLLSVSALAADATGTWSGDVELPTGQILPFIAHLQQNGMNITGTLEGIGGAPDVTIQNGMIHGSTINFIGIRVIQGENVRFDYIGELTGDNIDFTIIREGDNNPPLKSMAARQ